MRKRFKLTSNGKLKHKVGLKSVSRRSACCPSSGDAIF